MLTFDVDFGDILAVARTEAPSVIIFRLRNQTPAAVNPRLFRVISDCESELASGAIIIVEDQGYRVRRFRFDAKASAARECTRGGTSGLDGTNVPMVVSTYNATGSTIAKTARVRRGLRRRLTV